MASTPSRLHLAPVMSILSFIRYLQAPGELRGLSSYDNVFSATPQRVVEFSFESLEEAGRYFGRKEISRIFQSELPVHGTNIGVKVLALRSDYSTDAAGGTTAAGEDRP